VTERHDDGGISATRGDGERGRAASGRAADGCPTAASETLGGEGRPAGIEAMRTGRADDDAAAFDRDAATESCRGEAAGGSGAGAAALGAPSGGGLRADGAIRLVAADALAA